jgi:subtilase family serine protease
MEKCLVFMYNINYGDPDNNLVESREDNNVKQKTIVVRKGPKSDLIVTKINYSPGKPKQHQQVKVWYFVKNIGPGKSGKCYLNTTNSLNNYSIWHKKLVPALDPGRVWRYEGGGTSNQAGTYYLRAVIDKANKIDEVNETNNVRDRKIIVKP